MRMIRPAFLPVVRRCDGGGFLRLRRLGNPSNGTASHHRPCLRSRPRHPTPTPDFRAQCGEPTPPGLYGMKVSVQVDSGFRKLVDSRPVVENVGRGNPTESYCGKVGFDWRAQFCDTRPEGNPQRPACDALVTGRATDTGRYGPTWEWDDRPCQPEESGRGRRMREPRQQPVPRDHPGRGIAPRLRLRQRVADHRFPVRRLRPQGQRRHLPAVAPPEKP